MRRLSGAVKQGISAVAMTVMIAGAAPRLGAEERPSGSGLAAGDRVRVSTSTAGKATTGRLIEMGPDFVRLQVSGRAEPVAVPLAAITRLARSLGRRSSAGQGALIGTVAGTGLAAALVMKSSDSDCDGSCAPYAAIIGSAIVGAGALVGAISGALIRTERWESAPLGRIGVSVVPRHRGAALALSVRF
jgi:hypothetical protein